MNEVCDMSLTNTGIHEALPHLDYNDIHVPQLLRPLGQVVLS